MSYTNTPITAIAGQTNILRDQYTYNTIYKIIVSVKDTVNSYGTYDSGRENIKFDYSNAILDNFTPTQELITADENETAVDTGRNYIRIIYDRINKLV